MILAGIDEAGYGPLLGPLVVGCCAFEVEADAGAAALPCLWKRLGKFVSKKRGKSGRKLHINDSKLVYGGRSLRELERGVLTLASTWRDFPADLQALLQAVAPHAVADAQSCEWYQASLDQQFPVEQDRLPLQLLANALRLHMTSCGAKLEHLAARVVFERQFNRSLNATRNKSDSLFSEAAVHLDHLLRSYGDRELYIVCDRQGGRTHYAKLLRLMFEEWDLAIEAEADGRSHYTLTRGGHTSHIFFREKAEESSLPVAFASMLSKYLRETLMRRFNTYWKNHLPHVNPTAGYYGDGTRFLQDIDVRRRELGVRDDELIRCR